MSLFQFERNFGHAEIVDGPQMQRHSCDRCDPPPNPAGAQRQARRFVVQNPKRQEIRLGIETAFTMQLKLECDGLFQLPIQLVADLASCLGSCDGLVPETTARADLSAGLSACEIYLESWCP